MFSWIIDCSNLWKRIRRKESPIPINEHQNVYKMNTALAILPKPSPDRNIIKSQLTRKLNLTPHQTYDDITIKPLLIRESVNNDTSRNRKRSLENYESPASLTRDINNNITNELADSSLLQPNHDFQISKVKSHKPDATDIHLKFHAEKSNISDVVQFNKFSKIDMTTIVVYIKDQSGKVTAYVVHVIHLLYENCYLIFTYSVILTNTIKILQIDQSNNQNLELLTFLLFSLGFTQEFLKNSIKKSACVGEVSNINYSLLQGTTSVVNLVIVFYFYKNQALDLHIIDLIQLFFIIIFFNHGTTSTITINAQQSVISSYRNELNKAATKLFKKHTGKLRGRNELYGNAIVVKILVHYGIFKIKALYEVMSHPNVNNRKVKLFNAGLRGLLIVNRDLKIGPFKLLEIGESKNNDVLNMNKKFKDGLINSIEFEKEEKDISKKCRIVFEKKREEIKRKICDVFGKSSFNEIKVNGRKIFLSASSHEIDRMGEVLEHTLHYDKNILKIATILAEKENCKTVSNFIAYIEITASAILEEEKSLEKEYKVALENIEAKMNFAEFDKNYGIVGKRKAHFHKKALDSFSDEKGYKNLREHFKVLKNKIEPLYKKNKYGFEDELTATYHYYKHKMVGDRELTPEEYFKLCSEVAENLANFTGSMLTQEDDCERVTYYDDEMEMSVVKIIKNSKATIATGIYSKLN